MTSEKIPSLNDSVTQSEVSVALTEAGLLVERTEAIVRLYAEHHSWAEVKQRWHNSRLSERGSRHSAQKILRVVRDRLQAAGDRLPLVSDLPELIDRCPTRQAKAQIFYLYLLEEDALVRYVLHAILSIQGLDSPQWALGKDIILRFLDQFQDETGEELGYAESTLNRWTRGFRSVLRDIGVLEGPYDKEGEGPTLDSAPLHVSAAYSWRRQGEDWQEAPLGWSYLLQSSTYWKELERRLQNSGSWKVVRTGRREVLRPVDRSRPFTVD